MAARDRGRSVDQLTAENDFLRRGGWADQIGRTARAFIWGATAVVGIYLVTHAVEALAGKKTDANILVSFLASLDVSVVLSWIAGAGGVAYGWHEAKLRKRTVERLHGRIKALETEIDPGRSSSKLTPRGDTNPEDTR